MLIDILTKTITMENLRYFFVKSIKTMYFKESLRDKKVHIKNLFKNLENIRNPKKGIGNKTYSYYYFLELYNYFPNLCIEMIRSNLYIDIGYWKDLYLLWETILDLEIPDKIKYFRYNRLIEEIKNCINNQRNRDIDTINRVIGYNMLDVSKQQILNSLRYKRLRLSFIGKYCIRENSSLCKKLYWYDSDYKKIDYFKFMEIEDKKIYRNINSRLYCVVSNIYLEYSRKNYSKEIDLMLDKFRDNLFKKLQ